MSRRSDAAREAARVEGLARLAAEATAAMAAAVATVDVVELALKYYDLTRPTLPIGGGLALTGVARPYAQAVVDAINTFPKEHRMIRTYDTDPSPADEPERSITLPSLAEQNATNIAAVQSRIETLVAERLRINAEVIALRGTLVALQAANRHFVKLGAQLALPLATGPDGEVPADGDTPVEESGA
jgi:hypothetical protein